MSKILAVSQSFAAWKQNPVRVAHCKTQQVADKLAGIERTRGGLAFAVHDFASITAHPLLGMRVRPMYRTPAVLAFRRRVAERVRAMRKAGVL
jgi:hypothetical protein